MKTMEVNVYTNPCEIEQIDPNAIKGVPDRVRVISVTCDGKNPATVECVTREDLVERWRDHRSFLIFRTPDGPTLGPLVSIRRVWWGCS